MARGKKHTPDRIVSLLRQNESAVACKADKFRAWCRNCIAVHPTKLGDALMVRMQAS